MDSISTWFHVTWTWIENLSPIIVSLGSFAGGVVVTLSGNYFSHRLALRRDDRNRRLDSTERKKEYRESIRLDKDQRDIIEKCKSSGQKQFEVLLVQDEAEIRKDSDSSVIVESNHRGKFECNLHVLEDYGYIKITGRNSDSVDFYLTDPQPDERS